MPAIKCNHGATTDGSWDGPANEARIPNDVGEATLRKAFAWVDPDKDAETKAAYRFIHHDVATDGAVGAANVTACRSGIGVLNGARGGTTIPDADRQGVYDHLAGHLKDAGETPGELKSLSRAASGAIEQRAYPLLDVRVSAANEPPRMTGHAAVFNQLSEPISDWFGFGFREQIAPGAFAKTIRENDIWAFWAHNPEDVLGRNKAGTLGLSEDKNGLAVDIQPPDVQWVRDRMESVRRGDVSQMSFGFRVVKDHWEETNDYQDDSTEETRTLLEVRLFEVSPTPMPAYPQTDIGVRALLADAGLNVNAVTRAVLRARRGINLSSNEKDVIVQTIDTLRSIVPSEPAPVHSEQASPEPVYIDHSDGERLRRRLELIERRLRK